LRVARKQGSDGPAARSGRLRAFLSPGEHDSGLVEAAPGVAPRELLRRFWPFARPYRRAIYAGLVLVALIPAIQAAEIWLFGVVVDEVIVPGAVAALPWIAAAVLTLTLLGALLSFAEDYAWTWAGERFLLDLRATFFTHVQSLSLDTLDRRRLGDLLSRLTSDIQAIESFVLGGLGEGVSALARILFFTAALFLLDPLLAAVTLALALPFLLVTRRFARHARHAAREKRRRSGSLSAVAEESIANAALVQSHDRADAERGRLVREGHGVVNAELASSRITGFFGGVVALIEVAGVLAVIGLGTWAVEDGRLTIGGLLAFLAYLSQLLRPIGDLSHLAATLLAASAGGERVLELLDRRPSVRSGDHSLDRPPGAIEFEHVTFRYPGAETTALEDFTLHVDPGEIVALTGASGSGKSTVARLLLRFADPETGAVRIGGRDLRGLRLDSLRGSVGLLLQETMLFDASVHENIVFGVPGATREQVEAAAHAAGAHDFVAALPDGYDTRIGQRGRSLSGGQRRRLEIARTLLRDTPVVVLDEPTTGLDLGAAERVMAALRTLLEGRTAIVISHDPLLLGAADRVVELRPLAVGAGS
jgi:ABC-type multidrug transport system fused ATPase/permease subunit